MQHFFIIGAGRSGTTSLCSYLEQHPEILISNPKETGFFSEYYHRGWKWYQSCFSSQEGIKVCGEGTVNYAKKSLFPDVIARISKDVADAQLIYIVRDPIKRIESDWRYTNIRGYETLSFSDAIKKNWSKYIEPSNYLVQIDAYRKYFSDEKILILFFEDLKEDPNHVLQKCFHFLNVDDGFLVKDLSIKNKGNKGFQHNKFTVFLMNFPVFQKIKNIFPRKIWELFKPFFGRNVVADKVVWSNGLYQEIKSYLSKDSKIFLTRYGKKENFWTFKN